MASAGVPGPCLSDTFLCEPYAGVGGESCAFLALITWFCAAHGCERVLYWPRCRSGFALTCSRLIRLKKTGIIGVRWWF